jgi:hypothetical protein
MSSLVPTLAALLLIFVAGFGVRSFLLRNAQSIALGELIALSWFSGAALISLSLWLLGRFLHGVPLQFVVAIISVGFALAGFMHWRRQKISVRIPWPLTWFEGALLFLLCLEFALVFLLTFKHTLGWDGLVIWELKARYAYLNGGALPPEYFSDATRAFSHPEYPLFLPMIETWIYFWIGDCDQYWVKLIFPVFYASGMVLLAQAGADWSGRRWIGLFAASLFLFVPSLTCMAGGIIHGYADVPLSLVYLAAFYFLSVFARGNSINSLSIFIVLAAILPWIKRDGLILWFVLTICAVFIIWRRRGIFPAILSILPGICVLGAWQIYLHVMHARIPQVFLPINFSILSSNLYRLGPVVQALIDEVTELSRWSLLWFVVPVAFVSLAFRHRDDRAIALIICCLAPIALYCGTYLFSASPDYLHHVHSSLPRLLLHVTPLSILSIALALAPPRNEAPKTTAG